MDWEALNTLAATMSGAPSEEEKARIKAMVEDGSLLAQVFLLKHGVSFELSQKLPKGTRIRWCNDIAEHKGIKLPERLKRVVA
jgi:hypothetical protein